MSIEPQWGTPSGAEVPADGVTDRKPRRMTGGDFRGSVAGWVAKTEGTPSGGEVASFWARVCDADPMDDAVSQDLADEWVSIRGRLFGKSRPIRIVEPRPGVAGSRLAAMGDPYYSTRGSVARVSARVCLALGVLAGLVGMGLGLAGQFSEAEGFAAAILGPLAGWFVGDAILTIEKESRSM